MRKNKSVLVWDKRREPYLDYLRAKTYKFTGPEEAHGRPNIEDEDLEIYGWKNVPYDPNADEQRRRFFALEPTDLGGREFSIEDQDEFKEYPDNVVDAHNISEESEPTIEEPTPWLKEFSGYRLKNIPDIVHPTEDEVRFKSAECCDFSIELHKSHNDPVRLSLDREFSTYTLIRMAEEIEEFELPSPISRYLVSRHI